MLHLLLNIRNNALTSLFHRYLQYLYKKELENRMGKQWIREGDLDKELLPEHYQVRTLRQVLCNPEAIGENQANLFLLRGDKGDGRVFYLRKMIQLCYDSIQHLIWENAVEELEAFRFPVLVTRSVMEQPGGKMVRQSYTTLHELAADCITQQLGLRADERKSARTLMEVLSGAGKLAVFFEVDLEGITHQILERISPYSGQSHKPLAVFIENSSFEPASRQQCCCIDIEPLTLSQIAGYLSGEWPERFTNPKEAEEFLNKKDELVRILGKPERLLMYIGFARQKSEKVTISQIYEVFVKTEVEKVRKIRNHLSERELHKRLEEQSRAGGTGNPDEFDELVADFENTQMFHSKDRTFRFEGCRYYLAARSYYRPNMSKKNILSNIIDILQKEPEDTICFYADFFWLGGAKYFGFFFDQLVLALDRPEVMEKISSPSLVMARIIGFTNTYQDQDKDKDKDQDKDQDKDNSQKYFQWMMDRLGKSTYDSSIYEALYRLSFYPDKDIPKLLEDLYKKEKNPVVKRRIVYYFGYAKSGLPTQMLDDLCQKENTDIHLKYHVISALIDNYSNEKVKDEVNKRFSDLECALGTHVNPVLRSDFERLYALYQNGRQYLSGEDPKRCVDELMDKLANGEYWEKAHAAGALSRRSYSDNVNTVILKLEDILDQELTKLSSVEEADSNMLKTVSYIVEACCQLSRDRVECKSLAAKCLNQLMMKHIDTILKLEIPIEVYYPLETALSLTLGGLLCIWQEDRDIRKVLGKCFSTEESLVKLFHECSCFMRGDETLTPLEEKLQETEELSMEDEITKRFSNLYKFQNNFDMRYIFSYAKLFEGDYGIGAGVLFSYGHNLYAITCRHIFYKNKKQLFVDINKVLTSLWLPNSSKRYAQELMYPARLEEEFHEACAADDLAIFRLKYVPARLSRLVFSERNRVLSEDREDELKCLGTPCGYESCGKWHSGKYKDPLMNGYFSIGKDEGLKQADGFSGAPIINMKGQLYGIWQSSDTNIATCIRLDTILEQLKEIGGT